MARVSNRVTNHPERMCNVKYRRCAAATRAMLLGITCAGAGIIGISATRLKADCGRVLDSTCCTASGSESGCKCRSYQSLCSCTDGNLQYHVNITVCPVDKFDWIGDSQGPGIQTWVNRDCKLVKQCRHNTDPEQQDSVCAQPSQGCSAGDSGCQWVVMDTQQAVTYREVQQQGCPGTPSQ